MADRSATMIRRAEVLCLLSGPANAVSAMEHSEAAWSERLRIAGARLHPWIAHRVDRLGLAESLPAVARRVLNAAAMASVIDELRRRVPFVQYAGALDTAAIPFVVLKGMALAHTVYPVPAIRPMGDVDLWVERERIDDVEAILGTFGWRRPVRRAAYPPVQPGEPIGLELPGTRSLIELHTRPASLARIGGSGIAGVWDRAERAFVAGQSVRVLSVSDQLAHLCIHVGVKNGFADGLLGLLDIMLTARAVRDDETWSAIGAAHRTQGIAPWTVLTLTCARDLLGATVPTAYVEAAAVDAPDVMAAVLEQLWDRDTTDIRGVDAIVAEGAGGAFKTLRSYVRAFHAGPPAEGQTRMEALGTRLRYDLTGRVVRYVKAFARGEFRPERLAHRARMQRERKSLIESLERAARPLSDG